MQYICSVWIFKESFCTEACFSGTLIRWTMYRLKLTDYSELLSATSSSPIIIDGAVVFMCHHVQWYAFPLLWHYSSLLCITDQLSAIAMGP